MNPNGDSKRLAGLSRVLGVSLSRETDGLRLILRLRDEKTRSEIAYEFSNVSEVRFRGERTELDELVLMMAEDVSSRGWEGVRFRVKDYEEEFLSFLCGEMRCLT